VQGQITIPIVGHPCRTIEQIIPVYAPSSDGNNVTGYINFPGCMQPFFSNLALVG
jgi:hypothetical protein